MKKILLIEDNEMNRDMLSRRLERKGFDVLLAEDGAEGLERILSDAPDLVLLDLSLPVLDGFGVLKRVREDPESKSVPIIVLTAHAMEHDREKSIEMGADDFDTKPIDLPRLLGKMSALLKD